MLKILQAKLEHYVYWELLDVTAAFRNGRGTRDQIAICWITEKTRNARKTSTSASLITRKPLTVWITTNRKILKEMEIPDHLMCLLRNLCAGQETSECYTEQLIDSKLGKKCVKAVYYHPTYLSYSFQFSCSVLSDSLRPHGLQHARPPCPSPTPRIYSNSCPLSQWCHPTISSSVVPFSSCLQTFPTSGSFSMSQFFCIRWPKYWSFRFSISPFNEYSGLISFRMDWLALLAVQGTLKSFLQHHNSKASVLLHSAFFVVQLSHPYMIGRVYHAKCWGWWITS